MPDFVQEEIKQKVIAALAGLTFVSMSSGWKQGKKADQKEMDGR